MDAVKELIVKDYQEDYVGAINYASGRITEIYAEEITRPAKFGPGKRARQVSEANVENRGGRGRMRHDGRGGGSNRGYYGRGGNGRGGRRGGRGGGRGWSNHAVTGTTFGGIDVLDPTRDYSTAEWDHIGQTGRQFGALERQRIINGRGNGRGGVQQGRYPGGFGRGRGRIVNEVMVLAAVRDANTTVAESVSMASCGGRMVLALAVVPITLDGDGC
jgi:hypothetical protein